MANDRLMVYPYTFMARVVKFPFKFYYQNCPLLKYLLYATVIVAPVFYKIQRLSYSEANMIKYQEYLRKEREEIEEHKKHLL